MKSVIDYIINLSDSYKEQGRVLEDTVYLSIPAALRLAYELHEKGDFSTLEALKSSLSFKFHGIDVVICGNHLITEEDLEDL
jgi:hypothetical protein